MHASSLAQELVDNILENIEDKSDVVQSSLVCSDWTQAARRTLYKSIHLTQRQTPLLDKKYRLLYRSLEEDPTLILLIRELCVQWQPRCAKSLASLGLINVTTLSLKNVSCGDTEAGEKNWLSEFPSLKQIILSEVIFDTPQKFAHFFQGCPTTVQAVELHRVNLLRYVTVSDEADSTPEQIPLHSLVIVGGTFDIICQWFGTTRCLFNVTQVESLTLEELLCDVKEGPVSQAALLKQCSASVERLHLNCPQITIMKNPIDISPSQLPKLKFLILSGVCTSAIQNAVTWISHLSAKSYVRTIKLKVTMYNDFEPTEAKEIQPHENSWSDLDDALDRLKLKDLRSVDIELRKRRRVFGVPNALKTLWENYFPILKTKGLLNVE